jgi:hypothetical protein
MGKVGYRVTWLGRLYHAPPGSEARIPGPFAPLSCTKGEQHSHKCCTQLFRRAF